MAKILLVIPPLPERSYPGKFMGPDYLATALLLKRYRVVILDLDVIYARGENVLKKYYQVLTDFEPNIVGITNMSIQNDIANYLAWFTKKNFPKIIVIKGGFHEIVGWKYTIELHHNYVDACVVGEGEIPIQQIADAVEKGRWEEGKKDIPSLAWWDGKKVVFNSKKRFEVDPNLFSPTRLNYYPEYNFEIFHFFKTAQMMTLRGCPYKCTFCSESFFPEKIKYRDFSNIIEELDVLKKEGYKAIYFDDPTFTLKKDRVVKIIQLVHERGFIWGCNTRVDQLDEEMIKYMEKNGCVYIFCGVESLVPETLLAMRKTSKPQEYLKSVQNVYEFLQKVNIASSIFLIFGNARLNDDGRITSEHWEDIEYSLKKAIEMNVSFISMNILRLLPETAYSVEKQYAPIRPNDGEQIHAGHYDMKWYLLNGRKDIRSNHPIYRCFEGARSVNPIFASPDYAYKIIELAINLVNEHNLSSSIQTKIVVDYKAMQFLEERKSAGRIFYSIAPYNEIPQEVEKIDLLEDWYRILLKYKR